MNTDGSTKLTTTISTEKRRIPEEILVEILARLPTKIIARFKSVSKTWNYEIESPYFRHLFLSVNKNSSSSWSLMFIRKYDRRITEAVGFHGVTWDPPKSLSSYILSFHPYLNLPTASYHYIASSNGLILIEISLRHRNPISFVGNPILKQWVEIPPPPPPPINNYNAATGLVTRVENGVVTSFKVVRSCTSKSASAWEVHVYSSETGLWSFKELSSVCPVYVSDPPVNIDGKLYLCVKNYLDGEEAYGFLVAYDFYGDDDQCQVVPFPFSEYKYRERCLTTSRGEVMYVEMLSRTRFKVWRLSSNGSGLLWELSEEINLVSVGFNVYCIPLAMHPFDNDIIYLWSRKHHCVVTGNLRTLEFVVHQESENWSSSSNGGCYRFNKFDSKKYMDDFCRQTPSLIVLSQFVLPPGMDLVPHPPNTR